VAFSRGDILYRQAEPVEWVHLLVEGLVSASVADAAGRCIDAFQLWPGAVANLWPEGPASASPYSLVCRTAGLAVAIPAPRATGFFEADASARATLLEAVARLRGELVRNGACAGMHSARGRVAGLLLRLARQSNGAPIGLTQRDAAEMLGVQRTTVSECLEALKAEQVITWVRGRVHIRDAVKLSAHSCGCDRADPHPG
jgi:CRP-like cAMP-binding protein